MDPRPPDKSSRAKFLLFAAVILAALGCFLLYRYSSQQIRYGEADWPWWRGPEQSGAAVGTTPATWSATENVRWKIEVPGRGHGTPIVHSNRIFLASADEQAKVLSLYCYARDTGEELWATPLQSGELMHKSIKNTYASASAATDGSNVFYPWIANDTLLLASIDFDGNVQWTQPVAPFTSEHGYASSPCVHGRLVFVSSDNPGPSYITGLDRRTGKVIWQESRSTGGSYGTPVIAHVAGRDQLILSGQNSVVSYDPASGQVLWRCQGPGASTIGTVTWKDDLVFATCGAPPMVAGVIAIRGDTGHIAWQADVMANVPSALVVEDRLLVVEDRGTIQCLSASNGELLWKQRLGGNFSASPILAGGLVYLPNESGRLFIFQAGQEYKLERRVDFEEGIFASPVIAGGQIFLRTTKHLYCIGSPDAG